VIYELTDYAQAKSVMAFIWPQIKEMLTSGQRLRLEVKKAKRSIDQNAKFHAMIRNISKQMREVGSSWSDDDWKRLLIDQWAHETDKNVGRVCPSLDGERVVQLGYQSHAFTVEMASEFIEWLYAWAANRSIEL
jgi:hypothetical protein